MDLNKDIKDFNDFYLEFIEIISEFSLNDESFHLHDVSSLFRELGTTEEIKKKLVKFAVGMAEISKMLGMGFATEQPNFPIEGNDKKH